MNSGLLFRACLLGLVVVVLMLAWQQVKAANEIAKLIFFLAVGAGGGLWAVKYFIPWLGDALGTFFYSSGEEVRVDESMRAAAKLAQGDYEGAIAEFEKQIQAHPDDPHPVSEIAKIHCDRLGDPEEALRVLTRHLEERDWAPDDAAFLMFRIAEVHAEKRQDLDAAREVLEQVVAQFPNTRHSANAHHKLNEVDQAKFKQVIEERRRSGGVV